MHLFDVHQALFHWLFVFFSHKTRAKTICHSQHLDLNKDSRFYQWLHDRMTRGYLYCYELRFWWYKEKPSYPNEETSQSKDERKAMKNNHGQRLSYRVEYLLYALSTFDLALTHLRGRFPILCNQKSKNNVVLLWSVPCTILQIFSLKVCLG